MYRSSLWTDRERPPLQNTTVRLRTYTRETIAVLAELEKPWSKIRKKKLKLLVVRGNGLQPTRQRLVAETLAGFEYLCFPVAYNTTGCSSGTPHARVNTEMLFIQLRKQLELERAANPEPHRYMYNVLPLSQ